MREITFSFPPIDVPEQYVDKYNMITDSEVFQFMTWYKYPKYEEQAEFLEWYFKATMNIEFSPDRAFFRVVDYAAPLARSKFSASRETPYTRQIQKNIRDREEREKEAEIDDLDIL